MRIIESIKVHDIKNVDNHEIILPEDAEHIILTGYNNTGKSAILKAIACGGNGQIDIDMCTQDAQLLVWDRKAICDSLSQLDCFKDKPVILIIDDMEIGLDIQKQGSFISRLTEIYPNVQIIGSTHSPFVLMRAKNTAAYSLDLRTVISALDKMSFIEISQKVFGV